MADPYLANKLNAIEFLLKEVRELVTPKPPAPAPSPHFYDIKIGLKELNYSDLENVEQSAAFLKTERRKEHEREYASWKDERRKCPHCGNIYGIQYLTAQGEYRCVLCGHSWFLTAEDKAREDRATKKMLQEVA